MHLGMCVRNGNRMSINYVSNFSSIEQLDFFDEFKNGVN